MGELKDHLRKLHFPNRNRVRHSVCDGDGDGKGYSDCNGDGDGLAKEMRDGNGDGDGEGDGDDDGEEDGDGDGHVASWLLQCKFCSSSFLTVPEIHHHVALHHEIPGMGSMYLHPIEHT